MSNPKEIIAKRIAKEFKDGYLVNLGIGLPTMAANYLPTDIDVVLQSENGFVGLGPKATVGEEDKSLIDAGGNHVTISEYGSYFDSSVSFAMMRGGHIDLTVLGALQVDESGNIANWIIPGKKVPGMGGAMDLLVGAKRVVVGMEHTNNGKPKLLKKCSFPLTATHVVDRVITEMGVFDISENGMTLVEINPEYTIDDVRTVTEPDFEVCDKLIPMLT